MAYLELTQIEKHYDSFHALKNIDLQVEKEEFVVFVGPSGCGKSTLLRSICGLETVSSGRIVLDGQDITDIHPSKRNLAMVFQPLSNLDAKLRVRMRVELLNLHYETRNTVVYVTHDQVEAMTMADKIVVLQDGRIEQFGKPMVLYEHPVNQFVAGFIGSPQMNFLAAKAGASNANGLSCVVDGVGTLTLPLQADSWKPNESITFGVRPEHIELEDGVSSTPVKGIVNIVENLGGETYLHVEIAPGAPLIMVKLHGSHGPKRGESVTLYLPADRIYLFGNEGNAIPVKPLQ
jgi:multiple sugar transport system ATP-binding protein